MIKWAQILNSDSSVRDSLLDFVDGDSYRTCFEFIKYPEEDVLEIKKIKKMPVKKARALARRAARKLGWK